MIDRAEINVVIKTKGPKNGFVEFEMIKFLCQQLNFKIAYYDGEKVRPLPSDFSKTYYEKTMVIYNEKKYGRGAELTTFQKGVIALSQVLPSSSQDILDFYTLVIVLLKTFDCKKYYLGGVKCKEKDAAAILQQANFSGDFLNNNRCIKSINAAICEVELDDKFYAELALSSDKQKFLDDYLDEKQREQITNGYNR